MKTAKYENEQELIKKGIAALNKELGPIGTRRFIEISKVKREDSVKRHRKWQDTLKKDQFLKEIFS